MGPLRFDLKNEEKKIQPFPDNRKPLASFRHHSCGDEHEVKEAFNKSGYTSITGSKTLLYTLFVECFSSHVCDTDL